MAFLYGRAGRRCSSRSSYVFLFVLGLSLVLACGELDTSGVSPDAGQDDSTDLASTRAIFDLSAAPIPFGSVPFPDDAYLNGDGAVSVEALPGPANSPLMPGIRDALRDVHGFGATTPSFFFFDGRIVPESLPQSAAETLGPASSVFMIDADTASPRAYSRIPVEVALSPDGTRLSLRPDDGHPLVPGRRYAAVVTSRVLDAAGRRVGPAPAFLAIRDAAVRPVDAEALAAAYDRYRPVLASLARHGTPTEEIVALSVFRVQRVVSELADAQMLVRTMPAPVVGRIEVVTELDARLGVPSNDVPGLDVEGGVRHAHVGFMVHGTFDSPSFIGDTDGQRGFRRDAMDKLVVGQLEPIPFTLFVPRLDDVSELRVVLYVHGLGAERTESLALADTFAAAGYALLAIDLPHHGLRATGVVDTRNAITGEAGPDGFGDVTGEEVLAAMLGISAEAGRRVLMHPAYFRDSLRQGVVDLFAAIRTIRDGRWDAIRTSADGLGALGFSSQPIGLVGQSHGGGATALLVAALSEEVGPVFIAAPGGDYTRLWATSPAFARPPWSSVLDALGLSDELLAGERDRIAHSPEMALYHTVLTAGDPVAFSRWLSERSVDLLFVMARDDEHVPNVATESLARAVGAVMTGGSPEFTDLQQKSLPLRHNDQTADGPVTRALHVYESATHDLLLRRVATRSYASPITPPYSPIEPVTIDNPIEQVHRQMLHFFDSFREGVAEVRAPSLD